MKKRRSLIRVVVAIMAISSLVFGGLAYAQNGKPGDEANAPESNSPVESPVKNPAAGPSVQIDKTVDDPPRTAEAGLVTVNDALQIQGRLTDAGGVPINGTKSVTASIYDASSAGNLRCQDTDSVSVANGLFTMAMDFCTASDINGDQLWLGIQVDSDPEMSPRQEIYAVPYALGLRPGAIVKGADSYIVVSGNSLVKNLSSDTTTWDMQSNGAARVKSGAAAGSRVVYFPVTIPSVLYGQNVTIEEVTIYYKSSDGTKAYISRTVLNVQTDADSYVNVFDDATNRTSSVASSYSPTISGNNVISNAQGGLSMYLDLSFADGVESVDIGSIRLRLSHQ